jgi:luciferase-like monooxygenase
MPVRGASQTIDTAVTGWTGVTAHPHRFGGTEYRFGARREIGHVHGDSLVDIPFPKKVRDEVVASGRARPHHILPDSGWVSLYLHESADVERAIELFQLSYDLAAGQKSRVPTETES